MSFEAFDQLYPHKLFDLVYAKRFMFLSIALKGVKQSAIFRPILFIVYLDGLSDRLKQYGVSRHTYAVLR